MFARAIHIFPKNRNKSETVRNVNYNQNSYTCSPLVIFQAAVCSFIPFFEIAFLYFLLCIASNISQSDISNNNISVK